MRASHPLAATAILFAFACAKSEQAPADTAALSARNQATIDSIAAAQKAGATPVTTAPVDTAAPVAAATTTTTTTTKTTTTKTTKPAPVSAAKAPSTGSPAAKAVTTAPALAPVATPKPEVKPAAPPVTVAPPAVVANVESSDGKIAYEENCRKCHGVMGVPPKTMKAKFPKIVTFNSAFFAKVSSDSVVKVLTNGVDQDMKSFKGKLTGEQMHAVAAYIRTFGSN